MGVPAIPPNSGYQKGQAAYSGRGLPGGKGCASCHKGKLRLTRSKLRGSIGGALRNCKTHGIYCKGNKSMISGNIVSEISVYLKRRYGLR